MSKIHPLDRKLVEMVVDILENSERDVTRLSLPTGSSGIFCRQSWLDRFQSKDNARLGAFRLNWYWGYSYLGIRDGEFNPGAAEQHKLFGWRWLPTTRSHEEVQGQLDQAMAKLRAEESRPNTMEAWVLDELRRTDDDEVMRWFQSAGNTGVFLRTPFLAQFDEHVGQEPHCAYVLGERACSSWGHSFFSIPNGEKFVLGSPNNHTGLGGDWRFLPTTKPVPDVMEQVRQAKKQAEANKYLGCFYDWDAKAQYCAIYLALKEPEYMAVVLHGRWFVIISDDFLPEVEGQEIACEKVHKRWGWSLSANPPEAVKSIEWPKGYRWFKFKE